MAKFQVGQRVMYVSPPAPFKVPNWFHAASMGRHGYMHLNAKDEGGQTKPITGTIGKVLPQNDGTIMYDFFPDGWITPEAGWPRGFQCEEINLYAMKDETVVLPGVITDGVGRPLESR
jgi:hypothetical protein